MAAVDTKSDAEREAERVVRSTYAAFIDGDFDRMFGYIADDVVYHVPPPNPFAGDYVGKDMVRKVMAEGYGATLADVEIEVLDVVVQSDGRVALRLRMQAEVAGAKFDATSLHIHQVRAGLITESWSLPFDDETMRRFWEGQRL